MKESKIVTLYYRIKETIIQIPYDLKWFLQRVFRGYSDDETWDLDYTVSKYMLPRLEALIKRFKDPESCKSTPCSINSIEEWGEILDKILYAVKMTADDIDINDNETQKKINEGFELMGKYFQNLWD